LLKLWRKTHQTLETTKLGEKKKTLVMTHDSWLVLLGQAKFGCCVVVQIGLFREIGIIPLMVTPYD